LFARTVVHIVKLVL